MNNIGIIAKRVGGTLLIAWMLFAMFAPILMAILIPADCKTQPSWWRTLHIALMIGFAIAGWGIMKMGEKIRAKKNTQ